MAAIDFPASPGDGQLFSAGNGMTYQYKASQTLWVPLSAIGQTLAVPAFQAFINNAVVWATGSITKVTSFLTPTVNVGNYWDSVNSRWIPPAGTYVISGQGQISPGATAGLTLYLYKNGVQYAQSWEVSAAAGYTSSPNFSVVVQANGTDYFELWAIASGGQTINTLGSFFSAYGVTLAMGNGAGGTPTGVIQFINGKSGAFQSVTGAAAIPQGQTTPMTTSQGGQIFSTSITPKSASSNLLIEALINYSPSAGDAFTVGLFRDAGTNAIAEGSCAGPTGTSVFQVSLSAVIPSSAATATTFKLRMGGNGGTSFAVNGIWGASLPTGGGTMFSGMTITEIL
jgi:hypothetical protein